MTLTHDGEARTIYDNLRARTQGYDKLKAEKIVGMRDCNLCFMYMYGSAVAFQLGGRGVRPAPW